MIDGSEIKIGGTVWIVPPLNLAKVKKFAPMLQAMDQGGFDMRNPEVVDRMIDIIHAALQRNYPDLAREELEESLDLGNLIPCMEAVMSVSGLVRSGEATAVSLSRGEISTASSPQPLAGPGAASTI